jgi:site-specific recombinase XerD
MVNRHPMSAGAPHALTEGRLTLEQASQWFYERRLMSATYRPATQGSYRRAIEEFRLVCADIVYFDKLDLACVRRYDQDLQGRQLGVNSRRIKIAAVKAFILFLEEEGALTTTFAHQIAIPAQPRALPARPVDSDDAAALMRAVREEQKPRDIALMTLLLRTGMSLTQLTELTLSDLDLPSDDTHAPHALRYHSWGSLRQGGRRSSRQQEVTLDEISRKALDAYLAIRPKSLHPQLFLTSLGTPLSLQGACYLVKRYARAAGLAWAHTRSLRNGFVLRQLATGASLTAVQNQLGHRRMSSTRRYAGLVTTAPHATALQGRTCGVLIVHEQFHVRKQLRALLESAKHHAFEALSVENARDMLRLSRLSLVVLLSVDPSLQGAGDLLSDLVSGESQFAEHCVIALMEGGVPMPKKVMSGLLAHDIPIMTQPIDNNVLLIHLARAYAELGA